MPDTHDVVRNRITAIVTALLLSGCASVGNTTPQRDIAKYGALVMESVQVVQQTILHAHEAGTLPDDATAQTMMAFEKIGQAGQGLSAALAQYDKTVDPAARAKLVEHISELLHVIDAGILSVLLPLETSKVRSDVIKAVEAVIRLVLDLRGQLVTWTAVPPLEVPRAA